MAAYKRDLVGAGYFSAVAFPCVQRGDGFQYGGVVFLGVAYYLLFAVFLSAWALHRGRHASTAGTKRGTLVDPVADGTVVVGVAAPLPFEPATLAFRNITYDVTHSQTKKSVRLLRGITGVARPGTMTALMGASGAGASDAVVWF